jgi:N utilization substance protein B
MVEITRLAVRKVETAQNRYDRTHEGEVPNRKFIDNRFAAQLEVNKQLVDFQQNQKKTWAEQPDLIKLLYDRIVETDIYNDYMASSTSSYDEDRELWRKLYKTVICDNEDIDAVLEENSLYWNDDKEIVDTFVVKTIKRFEEKNGSKQDLLPEYKDEEDRAFVRKLFRHSILHADEYRHLMMDNLRNWDFSRIALMDMIIMQIALAEIMNFPNIPLSVSINEYVEIAKLYSTPRSGGYVNGMLDTIAKRLIEDGTIVNK